MSGREEPPFMLTEAQLRSKHHLANSPVWGNKGTGSYKWKPQPPERALWKVRAGNQVALGKLGGVLGSKNSMGAFAW